MPNLDWEEIFILFDGWAEDKGFVVPCSHTTVKRIYKASWHGALVCRTESHHIKCAECIEFKQWRKRVPVGSPALKDINKAYCGHIQGQMLDRRVSNHIHALADDNIRVPQYPPVDPNHDIFNVSIDAMEQAKFKLPQEGPSGKSKAAAAMWRPQLHVTGTWMSGISELWYLSS